MGVPRIFERVNPSIRSHGIGANSALEDEANRKYLSIVRAIKSLGKRARRLGQISIPRGWVAFKISAKRIASQRVYFSAAFSFK